MVNAESAIRKSKAKFAGQAVRSRRCYDKDRMFIAGIISIALSWSLPAHGMETDNFTGRATGLKTLRESQGRLDEIVNEQLDVASHSSVWSSGCDEKALFEKIRLNLNRNPIGEIERLAEFDDAVPKHHVDFSDTIYGKLHTSLVKHFKPQMQDAFLLGHVIMPSMKISGQIVGTDKLGHFFAQGYEYFQRKDWKEAQSVGEALEQGRYGLGISGVYSYGDLNANFQGMLFWRSILGGSNPYFECKDGSYKKRRDFHWSDYVSAAWDEGLNCSTYLNKEWQDGIDAALKERGLTCPVDPEVCKELVAKPCAYYLVTPKCFEIAGVARVPGDLACTAYLKEAHLDVRCGPEHTRMNTINENVDEGVGTVVNTPLFVIHKWLSTIWDSGDAR